MIVPWPTAEPVPQRGLYVLFTSVRLTRAALIRAQDLARNLRVSVTLLALQIVPYPLSLQEPSVSTAFLRHQLAEAARDLPDIRQEICLCRDLRRALPPNTLLVIATGRWFHRRYRSTAAALAHAGCCVIQIGS